MDEGTVEQERQPIDPKQLTVTKESFSTAFKELNLQTTTPVAEGDIEKSELRKNNPHILESIEELAEPKPENERKRFVRGALIFHRALVKKEGSKRKVLPKLTKEFVEEYDYQTSIKGAQFGEESTFDEGLSIVERDRKARRRIVANFRNQAPELSKIIESELKTQPDWHPEHPEEDDIYSGIIDMYLLMRAGFSDPKNFQ